LPYDEHDPEKWSLHDLSKSDLSKPRMCPSRFLNPLFRHQLTLTDLSEASMSGACLFRASLGGANLRNADLSETDLSGANLIGADLTGTDISVPPCLTSKSHLEKVAPRRKLHRSEPDALVSGNCSRTLLHWSRVWFLLCALASFSPNILRDNY
jgi:uncharacterized protein YjbI with pentapeptide repeats